MVAPGGVPICDHGRVSMVTSDLSELHEFDCPRCGQAVAARFYGPCDPCRDQLRATLGGEQHELEKTIYETKINVVPNHVATKE